MPSLHTVYMLLGALLLAFTAHSWAEPVTTHPCELLTESLVRTHFDIAADTVIERDDSSSSRFPNCGYRWRVMSEADEEEARAANNKKMMENLSAGRSPNEGINHNIPTHAQVHLTVAEFEDPGQARNGLESARTFMVGRDKQKGREPTPWEPVGGVGSKAYYHGRQLSFTWDRIVIHLDVSPRDSAIALAQKVMK